MPRPLLKPLPFALVTLGVLAADQLTKLAVVRSGLVGPDAVISGFFDLLYRENRGGAWGLLSGASESFRMPFFVGTSLVAIVFLLWLRTRMALYRRWVDVAFPAVLGGALGNLVDRVRLGYVVDFIDLHVAGKHWPTFNVADIGITLGVIVLVADSIFQPRSAAAPAPADPESPGRDGTQPESPEATSASAPAPSSVSTPSPTDPESPGRDATQPESPEATPASAPAPSSVSTPSPTTTNTGG